MTVKWVPGYTKSYLVTNKCSKCKFHVTKTDLSIPSLKYKCCFPYKYFTMPFEAGWNTSSHVDVVWVYGLIYSSGSCLWPLQWYTKHDPGWCTQLGLNLEAWNAGTLSANTNWLHQDQQQSRVTMKNYWSCYVKRENTDFSLVIW